MTLDFLPILDTSKTIKIYDLSKAPTIVPFQLNSLTLQITSSILEDGQLSSPSDLLSYIYTERQSDEIYEIRSDLLGVGEDQNIPDGVYILEYVANGIYRKEHTIVVYQEVKAITEALLDDVGYGITIGDYDISYVGDYSEVDLEKVRLAKSLLDEIEQNASTNDVTLVTDALAKLRRLLTLIYNTYG